jgi:hypothetical protein
LNDGADPCDHDHVREAEREPELLHRLRRPREASEVVSQVRDHVQNAVGRGDEQDPDDCEAHREQAEV